MNSNGRYSINMNQDNNFHIKVKRNSIPYNPKISPIISNNHIQMNDLNNFGQDKKLNKLIREDLIIKKMNKNKNKFQSLGNTNNLSSLINKQKLNKINNIEKTFQKNKTDKGIIDTLNKIRNNHKKLNTSSKANKLSSNYTFSNNNNNINFGQKNINDYRTKIINNKNKLKNTIFKTSSYNNEIKNSLKNFNINNYNKTNKKNNIFIDDTTSNDTDPLTESTNLNKETNLYVYRSEVQYPINNHISLSNLQNNNYNNTFSCKYNHNTLKTINTVSDNNYKRINLIDSQSKLIENVSKSVGNSRAKRKIYNEKEFEVKCQNNFFSPLQTIIPSNKRNNIQIPNNKKILNSENNFLKIKNKFKKLKENLSPILQTLSDELYNQNIEKLNNITNNYNDRSFNNNAKSCHQFYRKKCFSKEKNAKHGDVYSNKENSEIQIKKNEQENNIDNYKFYNRNRNKRINDKLKLKLITKFCDSVEKFLIMILQNYYKFFISKLNKLIESKNKNYKKVIECENSFKNKNLHNLLSRRIKNKKNPKKLYYFENDIISINLSNYKKNTNRDNKIYSFPVISRNDNINNIYKKKSNSINKSLNQLINKNNGEIIYNRIKKKKNLSFNKIYIPKHKNQKYDKFKSLKIDTGSFISDLNYNHKDLNNNNINNTCNSMSIYNHNNEQNIYNYQTLNNDNNDSIIKKINHITALKRKYYNKHKNYLTISTSNNINEDIINNKKKVVLTLNNNINEGIITNNKKVQLTANNVYSKPLFTKIGNKILEKKYNFNSAQKINIKENKNNGLLLNNNSLTPNENTYNSEKINKCTIKINNNLLCKKIVKRKKPENINNNNLLNRNQNNNIIIENNVLNKIDDSKNENNEERIGDTKILDIFNNNLCHKETEINNTCEIIRSIIVKDVSSKDKLLNVFIKYYESNFKKFNLINNNQNKYSLVVISNESIMLVGATNKNIKKNKNNKYLHQILSSIIEEDEKSKANPSLNNSNSVISEEDSERNNQKTNNKINNNTNFTRNIVIYLTNILQNLLDDNIKTVLYSFMRNFKKIQNKLYLKNSLIEYNSIFKNIYKENLNNSIDAHKNENQTITYNGGNEVEVEVELNNTNNGEEKNNSYNNIYCYTADNSLFDDKINNKKHILIGSLFFKDFEIKDEEYDFKPKKYFSSSSIKQINNNGSDKNIFNQNILKNLIIDVDNKRIKNIFYFWKNGNTINNNFEINGSIDNGMNISEKNNEKNKLYNIVEMNIDDFNKSKIKNINNEIRKEIILDNKNDEMENNIIKFKKFLISFVLKK